MTASTYVSIMPLSGQIVLSSGSFIRDSTALQIDIHEFESLMAHRLKVNITISFV